MQILMLTHNAALHGGTYWRAFPLARALAANGHEVTLIPSRRDVGCRCRQAERDGVEVVESPDLLPRRLRHGGLSPVDLAWRYHFVRNRTFDIVHSFSHRPAAFAAALHLKRQGVPLVLDWSDLYGPPGIASTRPKLSRLLLGRLDAFLEKKALLKADLITAICGPLAQRARSVGVLPGKVALLPVGANTRDIQVRDRSQARLQIGIPEDASVIVHTGYAWYDDELLAATVKDICRQRPEVLFLFAGRPRDKIAGLVRQEKNGGAVKDLGMIPFSKMSLVLACADVALLPYRNSTVNRYRYPNRLGDYMAAGLPVVINDTADAGELVRRRGIGVATSDSSKEMSRAVVDLLGKPEVRRDMGARALALAQGELSWDTLGAHLEELYSAVVSAG